MPTPMSRSFCVSTVSYTELSPCLLIQPACHSPPTARHVRKSLGKTVIVFFLPVLHRQPRQQLPRPPRQQLVHPLNRQVALVERVGEGGVGVEGGVEAADPVRVRCVGLGRRYNEPQAGRDLILVYDNVKVECVFPVMCVTSRKPRKQRLYECERRDVSGLRINICFNIVVIVIVTSLAHQS